MTHMNLDDFVSNVQQWADERALIVPENFGPQFEKLHEEQSEFIEAIDSRHQPDIEKEWADGLVVWLIIGFIQGVDVNRACALTWDKIKDRKGKLIDGQFVKEV